MVRQDKITYLITFFQNEQIEIAQTMPVDLSIDDYSITYINQQIKDLDSFPGNIINNRVLVRLGVITTSDLQETQTLMTEFIPFKKHNLLFVNIDKIGKQVCTAFNPTCLKCNFSEICDFYNGKNRWEV